MNVHRRAWLLPLPLLAMTGVVLGACGRVPDQEQESSTASQSSALAAKALFGTYSLKGEPFAGAVSSISLLPGSCDAKQDHLPKKADGAVLASFFTECADPACKTWKTVDLTGHYEIVGEGNDAGKEPKVRISLTSALGELLPDFSGVVGDVDTKYTMFLPNGTPLRATVHLKMKQADKEPASGEKKDRATPKHEEGLTPSPTSRCIAAPCECAAQPIACAGGWACVNHGCVCEPVLTKQ